MAFGLAIGLAGASAGLSLFGQSSQNSAIRSGMRSAHNAARLQMQQTANAGALEQQRIRQQSARALGSVRVAFAGRGASGGSADAIARQIALDSATDQMVVGQNVQNRIGRIGTSYEAEVQALKARTSPLILSALQGGISGFQTGLAIQSGINDITGSTT